MAGVTDFAASSHLICRYGRCCRLGLKAIGRGDADHDLGRPLEKPAIHGHLRIAQSHTDGLPGLSVVGAQLHDISWSHICGSVQKPSGAAMRCAGIGPGNDRVSWRTRGEGESRLAAALNNDVLEWTRFASGNK